MPNPTLKNEIKFAVSNAMAEVDPGAYTEKTQHFVDAYAGLIEQAIVRRLTALRELQDNNSVQDAHHEGVCQGIEQAIAAVRGEPT